MLNKTKTLTTTARQKKAKEKALKWQKKAKEKALKWQKKAKEKALKWTSQTGKESYKNHSEMNSAIQNAKKSKTTKMKFSHKKA